MQDRIGISWRPELSAGILSHLDRIDVIEVMADDFFDAPKRRMSSLQTLSKQVPVVLHGVSLGLASCSKTSEQRLAQMARVVEKVQPDFWSEHFAFVRAGGFEIGHLAAPPRTPQTIEGCAENIYRASKIVGLTPHMENIATLMEPPASVMDEATWISKLAQASHCDLLLDLHNLYANAVNFHFDPKSFLATIPLERVKSVHLSGGKWISVNGNKDIAEERRLLDDHLHDVPDPVYDLLDYLGSRLPNPVSVILERDGCYPTFDVLLNQLDCARKSLERGRQRSQQYERISA